MVHTTTGYATDTERNYRKANGKYYPLSKGGDLYNRGRFSTYSICMKAIKAKCAPDCPVMNGHSMTDLEKVSCKIESKGTVKVTKARYLKK